MQRRSADRRTLPAPGGFTLVEMLVATTLVVLMMLLFAQIYAAAIRSLNVQQAIARNDQRMRSVDLVLRSDLLRCSFRQIPGSRGIVPLVQGDRVHSSQKGYFYLSENNQSNPLDDLLQFTMLISPDSREHDQTPFYGRCVGSAGGYPNTLDNHPDEDDGIPGNQVGMSRGAEVSYFVRGGNLYRRMLLLRDPVLNTVQNSYQPLKDSPPPNPTPQVVLAEEVPVENGLGSFYQRYDYAAFGYPSGSKLRFLGLSALDNYETSAGSKPSLGLSPYRFGFDQTSGLSVEFAGNGAGSSVFFGRMTQAETGSKFCVWPASVAYYINAGNAQVTVTSPNPITSSALTYNTTTNQLTADGNLLFDSSRVNEDLLINNVESFDVEVWDPIMNQFVQLGTGTGFNATAKRNANYGPNISDPANNWVFDTGHPTLWDDKPTGSTKPPAYRPLYYRPLTAWQASTSYTSGTIVRSPNDISQSIAYRCIRTKNDRNGNGIVDSNSEDLNGNNLLDAGEDSNNNGILDLNESGPASGNSGSEAPSWSLTPGVQFQDNDVTWESFDNRIGLEMIRITIRTRDTTTGNPRQFSLTHSFVEPLSAE